MKCDVDVRLYFYANVVLSSSTTMFQEIGECMTKATDSVGSIHDVSSSASLSSVFSGLLRTRCIFIFSLLLSDCDTFTTFHRAYMSLVQKLYQRVHTNFNDKNLCT